MKSAGKAALIGLGVVGGAAIVAGTKMVNLASDAAEVDSKMKVVFGKELPGLKKNLDAFADATGASSFKLREQAADMGALLEPLTANKKGAADMSEQFVKLATDLGSFNNVPVDDALLAIRSGLVGESEPLRRFGVLINAAAVESEGLRLGLVKQGEEMTEQMKVQARASLIMKQTSLAQGDAERTAGSMSNQMKALRNNITDAATSLGTLLIPFALSAVQAFNDNWPTIEKVVRAVLLAVIGAITGVVAAVQYLRGQWEIHRETVIATWEAVRDAVVQFVAFFKGSVLPAIQNVISAAIAIWKKFDTEITTVLNVIVMAVKTFIQNMLAPFKIFFALLRGDWSAAWGELSGVVTRTFEGVWTLLRGYVTVATGLAKAVGKAIIDGLVAGLKGIVDKVVAGFQWLWNWLTERAPELAKEAGKAIGLAILKGIAAGVKAPFDAIKSGVSTAIDAVRPGGMNIAARVGEAIGGRFLGGIADAIRAQHLAIAMGIASNVAAMFERVRQNVGSTPEEVGRDKFGRPFMAGYAGGISDYTPLVSERARESVRTVVRAAAQAVATAKAELAAAFAGLAQAGLDAIEAKYAGWQPPSLLKAQREAEERERAALLANIQNTQAELQALMAQSAQASQARQALGTEPPPGMDPEEWKKQVAEAERIIAENGPKILAAQQQLSDLEFQQRQQMLMDKAAEEQKEHDASVEREKDTFLKRLRVIMREGKNVHARVMALLRSFNIDYLLAGEEWGNQLAAGLRAAKEEVRQAARELAQVVANNTQGRSPTKEGPLSKFDPKDAGFAYGASWAAGLRAAVSGPMSRSFSGLGAGGGGGGSFGLAAGAGGGGSTIIVPVYLNRREIARVMTDEQRALREGGYPMPRP